MRSAHGTTRMGGRRGRLRVRGLVGCLAAGAALAVSSPAAAIMIGPINSQPWQGASAGAPFAATIGNNGVSAPGGVLASAGAHGTFTWCTPYEGTVIRQFGVRATRYHASAAIARLELGVHGGPAALSVTDSELPHNDINAAAAGRRIGDHLTENGQAGYIASPCVWARIIQTGAQAPANNRIWSLVYGYTILQDVQGPWVGGVGVSGPNRNGWFTGPVTVSAPQGDNLFDRGAVTVQLDGAIVGRLGDLPNGAASMTVDPGPDGPHDIGIERGSASGEWEPALAEASFQVDRTPPELSVDEATVLPGRKIRISWSQDDLDSGIEAAWIEYRAPSGWTRLATSDTRSNGSLSATVEVPKVSAGLPEGRYPIRVVARDLAGNIGSAEGESLVIDQTPPRVSSWALVSYGGGDYGLRLAIDDASLFEIAPKARIQVNRATDGGTGGAWVTVASPEMDSVIDTDLVLPNDLRPGRHRLRATLNDDYGNVVTRVGPDSALLVLTSRPVARRAVLRARFAGARVTPRVSARALRRSGRIVLTGRLARAGKPLARKAVTVKVGPRTLRARTNARGQFRAVVPRRLVRAGRVITVAAPRSGAPRTRIRLIR